MKYLVTGGAGFIGSHICRKLIQQGNSVTVLDNLTTGNLRNLEGIEKDITFVEGDIRNLSGLRQWMQGVDIVFHQAAVVSVPLSISDPLTSHETNLTGTCNVFTAAEQTGVQRVVYASSCAVYGNGSENPKKETMRPDFASPYAFQKYGCEIYARHFGEFKNLETVGLRYFNVFGPYQDPLNPYTGVISLFIDGIFANRQLCIDGDGQQTRDFIYVEDIVRANLLSAHIPHVSGRVFNVGTAKETSINDLVHFLESICLKTVDVTHGAPRPGDIRRSVADNTEIMNALGFEPKFSIEQGLEKTCQWFFDTKNQRSV